MVPARASAPARPNTARTRSGMCCIVGYPVRLTVGAPPQKRNDSRRFVRSEEHKSELQSLMRISYAVFCLKKKKKQKQIKRSLQRQKTTVQHKINTHQKT